MRAFCNTRGDFNMKQTITAVKRQLLAAVVGLTNKRTEGVS